MAPSIQRSWGKAKRTRWRLRILPAHECNKKEHGQDIVPELVFATQPLVKIGTRSRDWSRFSFCRHNTLDKKKEHGQYIVPQLVFDYTTVGKNRDTVKRLVPI